MKVLAGFLRSAEGRAAMERAAELAAASDGELHLVGHIPRPSNDAAVERFRQEQDKHQAELDEAAEEYRARGITCTTHLPVGQGKPSDALLHVARTETADTIVIGLRRRSLVGKLVLGSNAQEILMQADCEVLAVKAPAGG